MPGRVGRGQQLAHHGDPGFSGTGGSPRGECGTALSDYSPRRTDCRLSRMPTTAACGIPCWTTRTLILRPRRPPALPTGFSKRCASVTSGSTTPGWLKKRFAGLCRIFRRRGAAADLIWHRDGVRPRLLSPDPAYLDALRSGDGDPLSDGVSTQVLLSRAPRWRGAE